MLLVSRSRTNTTSATVKKSTAQCGSAVSLQSDPDLLSFQQQLLTFTLILPVLDAHGQGLVLDVVGMLLDGAAEQAVASKQV